MSTASATVVSFQQKTDKLSVLIASDPPGRTETPALPRPRVAVHLGRSVFMVCHRAGLHHRGWAVHGDIDIVPAQTPCIWEPNERDTALIVGIEPAVLASMAEEMGARPEKLELVNRFQTRDPQIENICWAIKAEMDAGYPMGRLFMDSLATALAASLVRRHSSLEPIAPRQRPAGTRRARQAISFIEDNLQKDISLPQIAQAAGVSLSHLKTAFRDATGMPVHQYVLQRRVERASSLLREGSLSISEVARQTGFAHQSHMARHIRRILGCSPKELRDAGG